MIDHFDNEPEVVLAIHSGDKDIAIEKLMQTRNIAEEEAESLVNLYMLTNNLVKEETKSLTSRFFLVIAMLILALIGYILKYHYIWEI